MGKGKGLKRKEYRAWGPGVKPGRGCRACGGPSEGATWVQREGFQAQRASLRLCFEPATVRLKDAYV